MLVYDNPAFHHARSRMAGFAAAHLGGLCLIIILFWIQMRRGVGSGIPSENVVRLLPAFHGIVGIVAAVYPKNVFATVPHFKNHAAGVREKFAAVEGIPLST